MTRRSGSRLARLRLEELARARAAVDRAVARCDDPWRVTELRLRAERLAEAALAAEDEFDAGMGPSPRRGVGGL